MSADGRWSDACIHNASSRGLLVAADDAPASGSYVDIRRGSLVIIGRVVWRKGRFFGVRTQDRVVVQALIDEPRRGAAATPTPTTERRTSARLTAEGRIARRVERSRQMASIVQFGFLAAAAAAAAAIMADEVSATLARPLAAVSASLNGSVPE